MITSIDNVTIIQLAFTNFLIKGQPRRSVGIFQANIHDSGYEYAKLIFPK